MKMNHQDTEKQQIIRKFIACQERINAMEKLQNQQQSVLVEARDLFESLFELSPDALIVVDRQAHIMRVNTQAEKLFGYTREEMIGKDHSMLVPDKFREKHEAGLKAYMNQPHTVQPHVRAMGLGSALWGRKKDGSEFPSEIDMGPLQPGKDISVLTVIRDVTKRKQLEMDLLESEERYRRLFTTMSSGYAYCQIVTDEKNQPVDFVFLEVNESFEKLLGLKKADVLGNKVTKAT
jgi:PAS domain S-box-containing protein